MANNTRWVSLRIGTSCGKDDFGYWSTERFEVPDTHTEDRAIEVAIEQAWEVAKDNTEFIVLHQYQFFPDRGEGNDDPNEG